jgi:hypothetical protein
MEQPIQTLLLIVHVKLDITGTRDKLSVFLAINNIHGYR